MPLLLKGCPGTHQQLLDFMYTFDFDDPRSSSSPKVLPPELASRVISYLIVEPVQMTQVRPKCSSTHDGIHPLMESLTDSENTWWLSRPGTMPGGKGREYIQYSLTTASTLCRLRRVSIKIPPIPVGPLSVREFYLETFGMERGWFRISPNYLVENRHDWQTFELIDGGCDVSEVRVVCTRNQVAEYLEDMATMSRLWTGDIQRFASVGFFSIRFE